MESKYYTPDISEFHVGFEFEIKDLDGSKTTISGNPEKDKPVFKNKYKKEVYIIEDWFRIWQGLDNNNIRVKYLDRTDIESLGFIAKYKDKEKENMYYMDPAISLWFVEHMSLIRLVAPNGRNFTGTIKNKSELKKLLIQLSILEDGE